MSDSPPSFDPDALPPPLPDEESPFYGRAIVNGYFRFLSVSQVVKFDARQEGGCPRAWAYDKLFGKREEIGPDDPRNKGKRYAREGELYLKYGYDALSPVMRAGKHLLPKPGSDLEVEEPLAGTAERTLEAIALRDRVIAGEHVSDEEVNRIARLTACGIPFIGAADYAHHRGTYVVAGGLLVDEPYPDVTSECGDHKTTARINDHTTRPRKKGAQPTILMGYAKTPEKIGTHPQMLGYGVWQKNKHPHLRYVRLSHNYYQTKNGYAAEKRSILLTVDEIRARWRSTVVPVVREMIDVARVTKPEDVPYNLKSCRSFGRDCSHSDYCDRPARDFFEVVDAVFNEKGLNNMTLDLNALFPGAGGALPTPTQVAPMLQQPQSEEDRARQVAEERAKLVAQTGAVVAPRRHPLEGIDGYTVGQPCNGRGFYANANGQSFVAVEAGHVCDVCRAPAAQHLVGSVNPADAPPLDFVATADALSAEAIAEIENPELKAQAEAHARAAAQRAEEEKLQRAVDKPKTGCPVGQPFPMTDKEKLTRKKKCPGCGKELKIADKDITQDCLSFVVPKHKAAETQAAVQAQPPQLPQQTVVEEAPPQLPVNGVNGHAAPHREVAAPVVESLSSEMLQVLKSIDASLKQLVVLAKTVNS